MDLISRNPFRVLDVFSNATAKQISSNESRIKAFAKVGKTITASTDMGDLLDDIDRDPDSLTQAKAALNTPQERMWHALFWWACVTPADRQALDALRKGDTAGAMTAWSTATGTITRLNLAVLDMATGCFTDGAAEIVKLLSDPQRVTEIAMVAAGGEHIDGDELLTRFIEELATSGAISPALTLTKAGLSARESDPILMKVAKKPIGIITTEVDKAVAAVEGEHPAAQYLETGRQLMRATRTALARVRTLLGTQHMQYQFIADKLADTILNCGIACYNHCGGDPNLVTGACQLQEYALQVAQGSVVKQRCRENVDILKMNMPLTPPPSLKDEHNALMRLVAAVSEAHYTHDDFESHDSTINEILQNAAVHLVRIKAAQGDHSEYLTGISTRLAEAALNRMVSIINDNIARINNAGHFSHDYAVSMAKPVFTAALRTMAYIGMMPMTEDFHRRRYLPNRDTLNRLFDDIGGTFLDTPIVTTEEFDMRSDKELFDTCTTKDDFEYLLERFPNSQYATEARQAIRRLEAEEQRQREADERAWAACATPADRKRYYKQYSDGLHAQEAKEEIDARWRKRAFIATWVAGGAIILTLIITGLVQPLQWDKLSSNLYAGIASAVIMAILFISMKKHAKHVMATIAIGIALLTGGIIAGQMHKATEAERNKNEYEQLMANFDIDKAKDYLSSHYGEEYYHNVQERLDQAIKEKVDNIGNDTAMINKILQDYSSYIDMTTIDILEARRDSIRWADEATAWRLATSQLGVDAYERYLSLYPNGEHAAEAIKNKVQIKMEGLNDCTELPDFDHYGSGSQCNISVTNSSNYTLTILMDGTVGKDVDIAPQETANFTVPRGEYDIVMLSANNEVNPGKGHKTLTGGHYSINLFIETKSTYPHPYPTYPY